MESDAVVCEACQPDAEKVEVGKLDQFLLENNSWRLSSEMDTEMLEKKYSVKNFAEAQEFAKVVGDFAEKQGHHPRILLEYGSVTVNWWSHKIHGIHAKDLTLAAATDQLFKENFE